MNIQRDDPKRFFNLLLDTLIKQGRLTMPLSNWDERLQRLEKGGSITAEEHKILCELAIQLRSEASWMSSSVMPGQLQDHKLAGFHS